MEIRSVESFIDYYDRIHGRTMRVVRCIPPEKVEWAYREGKFTLGELLRHLAAMERHMFMEIARGASNAYPGHGPQLARGLEAVIDYMDRLHVESVGIIRALGDEGLQGRCVTPAGASMSVWKWLRAMIEHHIHHRGQIYTYLGLLGVETPPLYGLTAEQVAERGLGAGASGDPA